MKENSVDIYNKNEIYDMEKMEKMERINREIARKIEKEAAFNSYRFDPSQVNYTL